MEPSLQRPPAKSNEKPAPRFREAFLDPVAAWHALSLRAQEEIGPAAIAAMVGHRGATLLTDAGCTDAARPYDTARREALHWLELLVSVAVLRESDDLPPALPDVPDLRPLGFQQCQACGCTDNHPCEGGCSWAAQDLCSACAGKAA